MAGTVGALRFVCKAGPQGRHAERSIVHGLPPRLDISSLVLFYAIGYEVLLALEGEVTRRA